MKGTTFGRCLGVALLASMATSAAASATEDARPTRLEARPYLLELSAASDETLLDGTYARGFWATLRDDLDAPVPGRLVQFTMDDEAVCSDTTDERGVATCAFSREHAGSYRATFAGDDSFLPSSDAGSLVEARSHDLGLDVRGDDGECVGHADTIGHARILCGATLIDVWLD